MLYRFRFFSLNLISASLQPLQQSPELLEFLQENYSLVSLSIESNYRSFFEASARRIEYVDFLQQEYMGYFAKAVVSVKDENESRQLLRLVTRYDYLFQIHASTEDLFQAKRAMSKQYIELKSDVLLMVRELASKTLALFEGICKPLADGRPGFACRGHPATRGRQRATTRRSITLGGVLQSLSRSLASRSIMIDVTVR